MRPFITHALVLMVVVLVPAPVRPADPTPEQKVLDRFLGTWKTTYTVAKAEWTTEERTASATSTVERVLGGAYIQEKSDHSDGTSGMIVRGYDAQKKCYRGWWFSSAGHHNESAGTWDEQATTFSWTAEGPGFTTTARQVFAGADAFAWDVVVKDGAGKLLFKMDGKATRVK